MAILNCSIKRKIKKFLIKKQHITSSFKIKCSKKEIKFFDSLDSISLNSETQCDRLFLLKYYKKNLIFYYKMKRY